MTRLIALVLVSSLGVAAAQPAPPPDGGAVPPPTTPDTRTPEQKKAEAKQHYEQGNNHYNLGEYDAAIVEFKAAYGLTSAVGLLFNIAQSYRLKKDYENASRFYKTYLRLKPDAENRAVVEDRIKEMDTLDEEYKKQIKLPPQGMVDPEGKPVDKPPEKQDPVAKPEPLPKLPEEQHAEPGSGKSLKLAGIATAGVGVALVITGAVFGSMAGSNETDVMGVDTWTPDAQARYDAGKRDNAIAIGGFAVGGAAIVAGGVLWYLGYSKEHRTAPSTKVAVVPTQGAGTTVTVGWSF